VAGRATAALRIVAAVLDQIDERTCRDAEAAGVDPDDLF
jgi:hypothetical protein